MHKRGIRCHAVSVRPVSVTFVYCVETATGTAMVTMQWNTGCLITTRVTDERTDRHGQTEMRS